MLEALKLDELSMSDKFMMMEALWENMSQSPSANSFTPQWHLDVLDHREEQIKVGKAEFSSLADVKNRLRKAYDDNYSS